MQFTRTGDEFEINFDSTSPLYDDQWDTPIHPRFLAWINQNARTFAIMGGRRHVRMILTFHPDVLKRAETYFTLVRVAGLQAIETYEQADS